MAPVDVQRINVRGVVPFPVARYRHRLILTPPSRARWWANAATGDAHQLPEARDFLKRTSQYAKPWMFLADEIVGFRTNGTDTL
jgi:hypothetical protein